ncbi:MAG: ATP-binding cassette domain-containing protein [Akkermansia sp.]
MLRFFGARLPWLRRDDGSERRHAGTLVDLFATILMRHSHVSARDADAALDILRYTFPEVEHRWLASRFERSMRANFTVEEVLASAAFGRDEAERLAMALEVLSLLKNAGENQAMDELFDRVTYGLELPGAAPHLRKLLLEAGTEAEEPAFSVNFGSSSDSDVSLPAVDKGVSFRLIRCSRLVLVVNDGTRVMEVRGRPLQTGGVMPLTVGQVVVIPSGPISYEDFSFFLEARRSGKKEVFFLSLVNGNFQITRMRNRLSQLKISMGLSCDVEVLRTDVSFYARDCEIAQGNTIELAYHEEFTLNNEGPFSLNELKNSISEMGRRFQIASSTHKVRVTNLPEKARKGDMLMTPGLAAGVVFEVTFSSNTNSGWLEVIESNAHILINNRIVRGRTELHEGDVICLNAYHALRCNFAAGVLDEEYTAVRSLSVEGVTKDFNRGDRVLDNIDFVMKRGEMVCILGPSGSGKSTLLSILAGHLPPTRGRVRYNGQMLYEQATSLRPYIAYIPREDILDAYMSVSEHIYQATLVRRPKLPRAERIRRVNAILKYLGLTHIGSRRVGGSHERMISDGERTRLNLGLDLTGMADVFLLDEPISGLSSSDAKKVVDTLENLRRDKLVIATMHRPSTSLLNRFDKVLVLDHGGQMAYWGNTDGLVRYFRKAAADLGIQISADSIKSGGADYVFEVLEAPLRWHDRRRSQHPRLWQERFEGFRFRNNMGLMSNSDASPKTLIESSDVIPEQPRRRIFQLLRLFRLWMHRTFLGRVRSRMGMYTMLLEGPVLALLIALTLRASSTPEFTFKTALHIPPYLFLSAVVAMFFGLTGAASEILKDRPLLRRESNYRVFVSGYITAKALVLTFLAAIQSALYLWVGNYILQVQEMFVFYWVVMILTAFVGVSISLLVSVYAKTERAALNMVPLLLIPQVLLAGAMIPFEEMNQFIPWSANRVDKNGRLLAGRVPLVADVCPLRYSYEMLVVDQATNNIWEEERVKIQKRVDLLKKKPGMLTTKERSELKLLLRALTAISSLSSPDSKTAKLDLRDIRRSVSGNDEKSFNALIEQFEKRPPKMNTMVSYFVNDRIMGIYEFAEAQRQSRETFDRPSIFLAHRQPLILLGDGKLPDDPGYSADYATISTLWKDSLVLFIMGLVPLIVTGMSVRRRLDVKMKSTIVD